MSWFQRLILGVSLLLALGRPVEAGEKIRDLVSGDLAVLEYHLRHQGHRVRVEAGTMETEGPKLYAVLECRTEGGQLAFTWRYYLGRIGLPGSKK